MTDEDTLQRGFKSLGWASPVGFLMVFWAASLGGSFDWRVFGLSLSALALCWGRNWILYPIHEHVAQQRKAEWERYCQYDWRLMEVLAEFSGAEIDQLRSDVKKTRNEAVRDTLREKAPDWTEEDRRRFLEYFIDNWSGISSVYVDSNANIQAFD